MCDKTLNRSFWRLVFVGKLVGGVLGCYHVLERFGFLPRINWYCHCFLYYLRILLGHFPRPVPSMRKLFITYPANSPKDCDMVGEFLSMTRRDQRCVKLLALLSGDGFLLCSYVVIIYPHLTVNKGKQCVLLRHQPLCYWHMVLDFKWKFNFLKRGDWS